MKKIITIIMFSFFISGCSSISESKKIEIVNKKIENIDLNINKPDPIFLKDWNFDIINKNGNVFYTMNEKSFKNLNNNFLEFKRYIEENNAYINSLKKMKNDIVKK